MAILMRVSNRLNLAFFMTIILFSSFLLLKTHQAQPDPSAQPATTEPVPGAVKAAAAVPENAAEEKTVEAEAEGGEGGDKAAAPEEGAEEESKEAEAGEGEEKAAAPEQAAEAGAGAGEEKAAAPEQGAEEKAKESEEGEGEEE